MWWQAGSLAAAAAASGLAYGVRGRSANLFSESVYCAPRAGRRLAVTFDDGPSESTNILLNLLSKLKIPATFFHCGMHVKRLPAVAREVVSGGHEIGNHTQTHSLLCFRRRDFIEWEMTAAQNTIGETTGAQPVLFRPPYGARWFGVGGAQRKLGLLGTMWSTIGRDWKLMPPQITARLLTGARDGAIFCLHDGRVAQIKPDITSTLEAVRETVPALLDRGYTFHTVSDLLCLNH